MFFLVVLKLLNFFNCIANSTCNFWVGEFYLSMVLPKSLTYALDQVSFSISIPVPISDVLNGDFPAIWCYHVFTLSLNG